MLFYFTSVELSTLQKIVQIDFDEIILEDTDGTVSGMGWTLKIDRNKCSFYLEAASGGYSLDLEFPRYYLVDVLRDNVEVLKDLHFQTNIKRAN